MCIRDSWTPETNNYILSVNSINSISSFEVYPNPVSDVVNAVSYTHLRAHETVLDLVCRLLLEKKNTQGYTYFLTAKRSNLAIPVVQTLHLEPSQSAACSHYSIKT